MMSLNEKNARKTIDILQLEGCDINTALTLAGFNIRTDFPRLTDKECQDIAINYPYSYHVVVNTMITQARRGKTLYQK